MTTPRLSVALPVHNGENFLAEALDSILGQTFADFDLLVSENASTDATVDILADYARRDRRVQVKPTDTLLPQVANINRAILLAPGPWVKIICHDDLMRADCLARIDAVLDGADEAGVGLIGNRDRWMFANGYVAEQPDAGEAVRLSGRDVIVQTLSGTTAFSVPALTNATVRRDAFAQVGGLDDSYRHLVDAFCWLELLVRWNFIHLPFQLTTNRIHGGQSTAALAKQLSSMHDLVQFLPSYIDRHARTLNLPPGAIRRARLKPITEAAAKIANEWLGGRRSNAAAMLRSLPLRWQPLLVPLCLRAWTRQRRKFIEFGAHVPRAMIYP